jgi:hypothetical protein
VFPRTFLPTDPSVPMQSSLVASLREPGLLSPQNPRDGRGRREFLVLSARQKEGRLCAGGAQRSPSARGLAELAAGKNRGDRGSFALSLHPQEGRGAGGVGDPRSVLAPAQTPGCSRSLHTALGSLPLEAGWDVRAAGLGLPPHGSASQAPCSAAMGLPP